MARASCADSGSSAGRPGVSRKAAAPRRRASARKAWSTPLGLGSPHHTNAVSFARTALAATRNTTAKVNERAQDTACRSVRQRARLVKRATLSGVEARFGRYELVRLLDHGGMGEVWLAHVRGPERVHKTVVLKRIRAERANDEGARGRFAEEARVATSLSHPHIVPVFEFGELDGGYFLVMEWLRGGNLAGVAGVDREPLPWAATALIGTQLCDALAYVHARTNKSSAHLVHGDVTPRNVLFSTDGHALLADFGLARFAGRGRAGTLRYQAPEQARGEAFDARADLYALALVLAEAATGRPAYDRDSERATKQARVGRHSRFRGCDEELASVLRRALAASPDGRFANAASMRAAFEALLDREPGARAAGRAEIVARCSRANGRGGGRAFADRDAGDARGHHGGVAVALGAGSDCRGGARRRSVAVGGTCGVALERTGETAGGLYNAPPTDRAASGGARRAASGGARFAGGADARLAGTDAGLAGAAAARSPALPPGSPALPVSGSPAPPTSPTRAPLRHLEREHATPPTAPLEPALLDLNASPWAHVRIDGKERGETPLLGLSLPAGTHTVEFTNEPLGVHRQVVVTLRSGEHARRVSRPVALTVVRGLRTVRSLRTLSLPGAGCRLSAASRAGPARGRFSSLTRIATLQKH